MLKINFFLFSYRNFSKLFQKFLQIQSRCLFFIIFLVNVENCKHHVKTEINKLKGIVETSVSYEKANAIVKFDNSKKTIADIEKAINLTGYKVTKKKEQ